MSTKVSSWVWHECPRVIGDINIQGTELIVLLALADISDDNGNCTFGRQEERKQVALAEKTRLSESTFRRTIRILSAAGVVSIEKHGLMNLYKIHMEISDAELSTTGHLDRLATPALPVTTDRYYRSTVTGHRTFNVKETISPVKNQTIERKSQSDDQESIPLGWRARRIQKHTAGLLDIDALAEMVGPVLTKNGIAAASLPWVLRMLAYRVLAKPAMAGTTVQRPTSYVAAAIRNEPEVYRKLAFEIEAAS